PPADDPRLQPSVLLPGELVVGPAPDLRADLFEQLASLGVDAILSLQEEREAPPPPPSVRAQFSWAREPVADGHAGGTPHPEQLVRAVAKIQRWREAGRVVYVHCFAGMGRAPTVAAAYLAASRDLPLGEAIAQVRAARACARPTAQQLIVLADYIAA